MSSRKCGSADNANAPPGPQGTGWLLVPTLSLCSACHFPAADIACQCFSDSAISDLTDFTGWVAQATVTLLAASDTEAAASQAMTW